MEEDGVIVLADEVSAICEELVGPVERHAVQLRAMCKQLRRELGRPPAGGAATDDAWGVVTDLMSTMGIGNAQEPPPVSGPAADPTSAAAFDDAKAAAKAGDLGPALELLGRGPERLWRAGVRLTSELAALHGRLGVLRAEWSEVRVQLGELPAEEGKRLEQKAVREARRCKADAARLLERMAALQPELEDALEQRRVHREERLQWKAMSQSLLSGLSPTASKAVAMSRLRRGVAAPMVVSVPAPEAPASLAVWQGAAKAHKPLGLKEALRSRGGQNKASARAKAESTAAAKLRSGDFGFFDLASLVSWSGPTAAQETNTMGLLFAAATSSMSQTATAAA